MKVDEIVRRQSALESDRNNIEGMWDLIETFVVPYRGKFFYDQNSESEVDWRNRDLYDTTAIGANETLASSIHGAMTNPSYQWFDMNFRDTSLKEDNEALRWIQKVAADIYYMLQESNFNLEISETYIDLTSFGTSIQLMESQGEGENTELIFKNIPLKECYFEQDHRGQVSNFYRKLKMTPIQMASKWGESIPTCVREKLDTSAANTKEDVIFCVFKRDVSGDKPSTAAPIAPSLRPYGYKYVLCSSREILGEEGGYYEMPAFAGRWRRTSESAWGNSPAMMAMPDILTLNQLVQLILRAAEKVVDPATMVTERGLLSDLDLEAGGLTVVRTLDDMKPYESGARFDVSELQRDKLQTSIRDMFHVNELQLKDSPAMTATEVQVRYELMQRLLGPTSGRIQNDLLSPIIQRVFMIRMRAGLLPEMPDSLKGMEDIDIQYTGPLARAQKSDEALATERWLQGIAAMAEIYPAMARVPDPDAIARGLAESLNVPAKFARSKQTIDAEIKAEQEAMKQQQQMEQLQQGGEAAKSLGEGAKALGEASNVQ